MSFDIPLFELNFGEEEAQAVAEAVRSRWISMGPRTAELERRFAEHIQAPYALAVNSCTAALHIATARAPSSSRSSTPTPGRSR